MEVQQQPFFIAPIARSAQEAKFALRTKWHDLMNLPNETTGKMVREKGRKQAQVLPVHQVAFLPRTRADPGWGFVNVWEGPFLLAPCKNELKIVSPHRKAACRETASTHKSVGLENNSSLDVRWTSEQLVPPSSKDIAVLPQRISTLTKFLHCFMCVIAQT